MPYKTVLALDAARDAVHGGLAGSCESCPFNEGLTEEATQAQNFGCLPDAAQIVAMQRRSGLSWACHSDETQVCSGLCHAAKANELVLKRGPLITLSDWTQVGEAEAMEAARTGLRVESMTGTAFNRWTQPSRLPDRDEWLAPQFHAPQLPYYHPSSQLHHDNVQMFVASTTAVLDSNSGWTARRIVGLIETVRCSRTNVRALKYISVAPEFRRRGLARRLVRALLDHQLKEGSLLELSRYSAEGQQFLKPWLEPLLEEEGIGWRHSSPGNSTQL